jgi:hypothetical protein
MNFWLCLATFAAKQANYKQMSHMGPEFKIII